MTIPFPLPAPPPLFTPSSMNSPFSFPSNGFDPFEKTPASSRSRPFPLFLPRPVFPLPFHVPKGLGPRIPNQDRAEATFVSFFSWDLERVLSLEEDRLRESLPEFWSFLLVCYARVSSVLAALCVFMCGVCELKSFYGVHTLPDVNVCPHTPSLLRMHASLSRAPDSLLGRVTVVSGLDLSALPTA